MRAVTLRIALGLALGAGVVAWTAPAGAQVTIAHEPERALLYSADSDHDCSELNLLQGDALPRNVVRLRAQATPGADRYEWSLPKPQVGVLLADEPLEPTETTAAIRGFCAEFGNSCLLTKETLRFYNKDTILYAAPTCDVLPNETRAPFLGGSVAIKVTARAGNKRLGKAVTQVQWGDRAPGYVTLYTNYESFVPGEPRLALNGEGEDSVPGFAETDFNAIETVVDSSLPPVSSFAFEFAGAGSSAPTCPIAPEDVCATLMPGSPGLFTAKVSTRLEDDSALCDALRVNVGVCRYRAQVQIIRVPSKRTYASGDAVRLRVRLANLSENQCSFELRGASVLTCSAEFKIGDTEDTKTDRWDLQHCSVTDSQPCTSDADCRCPSVNDCPCPTCELNETCLLESHCSETFTVPCASDSDCDQQNCPACKDDETCVNVLEVPEIDVASGQAVDLVDQTVILKNEIGSPVAIKETWTANAFPGITADSSIKYKIKTAN